MYYFDFHSHILPGADDGSDSMEETMHMLNMAYGQGIREIAATPHYQCGNNRRTAGQLKDILEQVRKKAASAVGSDLQIYSGNEVLYFDSMTEDLKEGKILTLGDSRCVLTEFYDDVSYRLLYQAVRKLAMARYQIVLAHAERYICLRKKGALDELIDAGALIQINFGSLTGGMFSEDVRWCRKQVLEGRVHVLGTDAHHEKQRKPDILPAVRWLERHLDSTSLRRILLDNGRAILNDEIQKVR